MIEVKVLSEELHAPLHENNFPGLNLPDNLTAKDLFNELKKYYIHPDSNTPNMAFVWMAKCEEGGEILAHFLRQDHGTGYEFDLSPCVTSSRVPLGSCKTNDFALICDAIAKSPNMEKLNFNMQFLSAIPLEEVFSKNFFGASDETWNKASVTLISNAKTFANALARNKSIRTLSLNGQMRDTSGRMGAFKVDDRILKDAFGIILEGLQLNQSITTLELCDLPLRDEATKFLADFCSQQKNTSIHTVVFDRCSAPSIEGAEMIYTALTNHPYIVHLPKSLVIPQNNWWGYGSDFGKMAEKYCALVTKFLTGNKTLKEFSIDLRTDMSNISYLSIIFSELAKALKNNTVLEKLTFINHSSEVGETLLFLGNLTSEQTNQPLVRLKSIVIDDDTLKIDEDDNETISSFVRNNHIEQFQMDYAWHDKCKKINELMTFLFDNNSGLTKLQMNARRGLGIILQSSAMDALKSNKKITELFLSGFYTSDLNTIINENRNLESIVMYHGYISDDYADRIANALQNNVILQKLDIDYSRQAFDKKFGKLLERNHDFKKQALIEASVKYLVTFKLNRNLSKIVIDYLTPEDYQDFPWKPEVAPLLLQYQSQSKPKQDNQPFADLVPGPTKR